MNKFSVFGLSEHTLSSLEKAGFETPTEVQEKTIGLILAGEDVVASAQTGTGKTGAFAIPIIQRLFDQKRGRTPSALVLVPTRELALQVKAQFDLLGKNVRMRCTAVYGGTGYGAQINGLAKGTDVIVATPGRLIDLIKRRLVNLSTIQFVVLDEADRMLDMGFQPQVQSVLSALTAERQTMMFTATLDDRICELSNRYMNSPRVVRCRTVTVVPALITQRIHRVPEIGKEQLLLDVLQECDHATVLVFTKTRRKASQVAKSLRDSNVHAEEIHGDISQSKRERTLRRYRDGAFRVLVATDIAARGLDVPAITHVVNYDIPQSPSEYVHRIGRTGRAGQAGIAHTFIADSEIYLVRNIEKLIGLQLLSGGATARAAKSRFHRRTGGRKTAGAVAVR